MTEAEWQAIVCQLLDLGHWRWVHFRPARTGKGWRTALSGSPGFPDLVATRGPVREQGWRLVFIELKSERGRPTVDQAIWITEVRLAGAEAYVWRPSDRDEAERVLR